MITIDVDLMRLIPADESCIIHWLFSLTIPHCVCPQISAEQASEFNATLYVGHCMKLPYQIIFLI